MSTLIKRILVPTDNSENSREALRYAINLAERFKSTIYVVHVIDVGYLFTSNPYVVPMRELDMEKKIVKERTKKTEEFIKENTKDNKGIKIEKIIKRGNPFIEILIAAREKEVDLIVMGTHGRIGVSHALMGSVAEKVVREAPCPVVTVNPKNYKFKVA